MDTEVLIQQVAEDSFSFLDVYAGFIECLSLTVGFAGVLIIFSGVLRALWVIYIEKDRGFPHARLILGSHLVLGLDFFVGQDIIDTVVLRPQGEVEYIDLALLITVVGVRIILNYFLLRELYEIRKEEEERKRLGKK